MRRGFDIGDIRTAARLGNAQRAAFFARQQIGQGAGSNFIISQFRQRLQHNGARADAGHHATGRGAAHFNAHRFAHMHIIKAEAAIFFRNIETKDAELADFFVHLMWIASGFFPIINMRINLGFHKLAHIILKGATFFCLKRVQHFSDSCQTFL